MISCLLICRDRLIILKHLAVVKSIGERIPVLWCQRSNSLKLDGVFLDPRLFFLGININKRRNRYSFFNIKIVLGQLSQVKFSYRILFFECFPVELRKCSLDRRFKGTNRLEKGFDLDLLHQFSLASKEQSVLSCLLAA